MSPSNPSKPGQSKKMILWWVQTEDQDEDWFIVAPDGETAETFFVDAEGYEEGDAWADFILWIPDDVEAEVGWPSHELLVACGAKILREDTPRVVEIEGRRFCEGMLEHEICQLSDDAFEATGRGRPNKTEPRTKN